MHTSTIFTFLAALAFSASGAAASVIPLVQRGTETVNPAAITGTTCTAKGTALNDHDINVALLSICGGISGTIEQYVTPYPYPHPHTFPESPHPAPSKTNTPPQMRRFPNNHHRRLRRRQIHPQRRDRWPNNRYHERTLGGLRASRESRLWG
jgi:hypothetical protein